MSWRVEAQPNGNNPGIVARTAQRAGVGDPPAAENVGGTIVYLSNGDTRQEVSRVAFMRRAEVTRNPELSYKQAFRQEVKRANEIADSLNEMADTDGRLA